MKPSVIAPWRKMTPLARRVLENEHERDRRRYKFFADHMNAINRARRKHPQPEGNEHWQLLERRQA